MTGRRRAILRLATAVLLTRAYAEAWSATAGLPTTLAELVHPGSDQAIFRGELCARCQKLGVKCLTWLTGGYCNGLARASDTGFDKPLCANCNQRVGEVGRSVLSWSLIGAFGGLLRPKK